MTLKKLSEVSSVSYSYLSKRASKEKWVQDRAKFREEVKGEAKEQIASDQRDAKNSMVKSIVDEVQALSRLAYLSMVRLSEAMSGSKTVQCPHCMKQHVIPVAKGNISATDISALIRLRGYLKGDPDYVVKAELENTERLVVELSDEELREEMLGLIRVAKAQSFGALVHDDD